MLSDEQIRISIGLIRRGLESIEARIREFEMLGIKGEAMKILMKTKEQYEKVLEEK